MPGERVANVAPTQLCHAPEQRAIGSGRPQLLARAQGGACDAERFAASLVEGGRDVRAGTVERNRRRVRAASHRFEHHGAREAVGSGDGRPQAPEGFAPSALVHDVGAEAEHTALGVRLEPDARVVGPASQVACDLTEEPRRALPAGPTEAPAILEVTRERRSPADADGPRGEDRITLRTAQMHLSAALRQRDDVAGEGRRVREVDAAQRGTGHRERAGGTSPR